MTDRLEDEINRGQKAAQILAEPLMVEAFEILKQECHEKWLNSPVRDLDGREKLWLMLKASERVQQHLRSILEAGKLAEATLRQRAVHLTGRASIAF